MTDPVTTYKQRLNALQSPRAYAYDDTHLRWNDVDGVSGELPLTDVSEVKQYFAPTRYQRNRYITLLTSKSGQQLPVSNEYCNGILDFTDQSADYVPFVQGLHRAIVVAGGSPQFRAGSGMGTYIFSLLITFAVAALVLFAAVFLLLAGMLWVVAIKVVVILFLLPVALRWLRNNKPSGYDPTAIPDHLLPKV